MRMFFIQQNVGQRLTDLIVESLGYAEIEKAQQAAGATPEEVKERELKACCACIQTLSILKKGSNNEKLYFYCRLFDINGDGVLEPHELKIFSDVMYESYHAHRSTEAGEEEEERAKEAIDVLLQEIVGECNKTPEGGIKIEVIQCFYF